MFGLTTTIAAFVLGVVFAVPVTAWWKSKSTAVASSAASAAATGVSAVVADVKKAL